MNMNGTPKEGRSLERILLSEYLNEIQKKRVNTTPSKKSPYTELLRHTNIVPSVEPYQQPIFYNVKKSKSSARGSSRNSRRHEKGDSQNVDYYDSSDLELDLRSDRNADIRKHPHQDDTLLLRTNSRASSASAPMIDATEKRRSNGSVVPYLDTSDVRTDRTDTASISSNGHFHAPAGGKPNRPHSSHHVVHSVNRSAHSKTGLRRKKRLPTYLKVGRPLVVMAFKNGQRGHLHRVAAPTFELLLEECTHRLQLPACARRLFLSDGTEVTADRRLPKECEVYVSMGEPFIDPNKIMKEVTNNQENATWGLKGVKLPENRKRKTTSAKLSKEFEARNTKKKQRFLVFANGNGHSGCEIAEDIDNLAGFLHLCTAQFNFNTPAREIFTWDGCRIINLHAVEQVDVFLKGGKQEKLNATCLGPLWITKGERLSPCGVEEYFQTVLRTLKHRYRTACHYRDQMQLALDGENDKVEIKHILSMKTKEIEEGHYLAEEEINSLKEKIRLYKSRIESVSGEAEAERAEGSRYTQSHVKETKYDPKLCGLKGIKLKIYENGDEHMTCSTVFNIQKANKVFAINRMKAFHMLLDHISEAVCHASGISRSKGVLVHRLFDENGKEIKEIKQLKEEGDEMKIWASRGEGWMSPKSQILSLNFYQIIKTKDENKNCEYFVYEDYNGFVVNMKNKKVAANWRALDEIPDEEIQTVTIKKKKKEEQEEDNEYKFSDDEMKDLDEDRQMDKNQTQNNYAPNQLALTGNLPLLQNKDKTEICLLPEICMVAKSMKKPNENQPGKQAAAPPTNGNKDSFDPTAALCTWMVNKKGEIYPKYLPQMCLSVCPQWPISIDNQINKTNKSQNKGRRNSDDQVNDEDEEAVLRGYYVTLREKTGGGNQIWRFTSEGLIVSENYPEMALAYLGGTSGMDGTPTPVNKEADTEYPKCLKPYLGVFPGNSSLPMFRWGIKQEKFDLMCQWKNNKGVSNPKWNKRALSWPVDEKEEWNDKFIWPMEGVFVPFAPPLYQRNTKIKHPKQMQVVRNGERDFTKAIAVSGPDLSKLMKSNRRSDNQRLAPTCVPQDDQSQSSIVDDKLHCMDDSLFALEMRMFLNQCTSLLALTSPGRRIFDTRGDEHYNLKNLQKNELIFISTGEDWIDPQIKKEEHQQKQKLTTIAKDVEKMEFFVTLRKPENLIISVDPFVSVGSKLIVRQIPGTRSPRKRSQSNSRKMEDNNESRTNDDSSTMNSSTFTMGKSAHEVACERSDERTKNKLKWPWEHIVNADNDDSPPAQEESEFRDHGGDTSYRSSLLTKSPRRDVHNLCKFSYNDGYICCQVDTNFVLAVEKGDGKQMEIVIEKKKYENPDQKWIIHNNGFIQSKYRHGQVFTVRMPRPSPTELNPDLRYEGCPVTLQAQKLTQFGAANQKFRFNPTTGFIHCFETNTVDKEITVATALNVCTFNVCKEELHQPGYLVYLPTKKKKATGMRVCLSCAKSLRGKYPLQKLREESIDFACCFGRRHELGIKDEGSFSKFTSEDVDLSSIGAEESLRKWKDIMEQIKQGVTVKLANWLPSVAVDADWCRAIRVRVYRNGEGRLGDSVNIIGKSIEDIMDQATRLLHFPWAVRLMFMEDGTPAPDTKSIFAWYVANRDKAAVRSKEISEGILSKEELEMKKLEMSLIENGNSEETLKEGEDGETTIKNKPKSKKSSTKNTAELKSVLNEEKGFYEIGPQNCRATRVYELIIVIRQIQNLQKISKQLTREGKPCLYSLMFQLIDVETHSDAFSSEEDYVPDETTISMRGTLKNLKKFFDKSFSQLVVELHHIEAVHPSRESTLTNNNVDLNETMESGNSEEDYQLGDCLAVCHVPLNQLISKEIGNKLFGPVTRSSVYLLKPTDKYEGGGGGASHQQQQQSTLAVELQLKLSDDQMDNEERDYHSNEESESDSVATVKEESAAASDQEEELAVVEKSANNNATSRKTLTESKSLQKNEREEFIFMAKNITMELWASCGEPFVLLTTANENYKRILQRSLHTAPVIHEMDKQRFILQQMQARRMEGFKPGQYLTTNSVDNPVVIAGNWQNVPEAERQQLDRVHSLRDELDSVRQNYPMPEKGNVPVDLSRDLYRQPKLKRVRIYMNGESTKKAVYVWGESLIELLENASMRMSLFQKQGKYLFRPDGQDIKSFQEITRDDLLCMSTGEAFCPPHERIENIEVKANWGRARKHYGPKATEMNILIRPPPVSGVGLDPFAPPFNIRKPSPARPVPEPTFSNKRVLVYLQGEKENSAQTVWGGNLVELLSHAQRRLRTRQPIQQLRINTTGQVVNSIDDISDSDTLLMACTAASLSHAKKEKMVSKKKLTEEIPNKS